MPIDPSHLTPTEIGAAGALAWGGKELAIKLLGPSCDKAGALLANLPGCAKAKVEQIFQRAAAMLGPKLEQSGSVPPKIVFNVATQGALSDDEISTEYLAGVLASSRSSDGIDDRGIAFVTMTGRLSHYTLLLHYLMYQTVWSMFAPQRWRVGSQSCRNQMIVGYRFDEIAKVTGWERKRVPELVNHCLISLTREALIDASWHMQTDYLQKQFGTKEAFIARPSLPGFELFLWGRCGKVLNPVMAMCEALEITPLPTITLPEPILPKGRAADPPIGLRQDSGTS